MQNYQIHGVIKIPIKILQIPNKITLEDESGDMFTDSLELSIILNIENPVPDHNMLFKSLKDFSDLSVCDICPVIGRGTAPGWVVTNVTN